MSEPEGANSPITSQSHGPLAGLMRALAERDLAWILAEGGRILRFGLVGVAATLTHVVVIVALVELAGMASTLANPLAFLTAVVVSYLGHYFFTYRSSHGHKETATRFLAVSGSSFGISQAVVMLVAWAGGPYEIAVAIFAVLVPAVNFLLLDKLVFRRG